MHTSGWKAALQPRTTCEQQTHEMNPCNPCCSQRSHVAACHVRDVSQGMGVHVLGKGCSRLLAQAHCCHLPNVTLSRQLPGPYQPQEYIWILPKIQQMQTHQQCCYDALLLNQSDQTCTQDFTALHQAVVECVLPVKAACAADGGLAGQPLTVSPTHLPVWLGFASLEHQYQWPIFPVKCSCSYLFAQSLLTGEAMP